MSSRQQSHKKETRKLAGGKKKELTTAELGLRFKIVRQEGEPFFLFGEPSLDPRLQMRTRTEVYSILGRFRTPVVYEVSFQEPMYSGGPIILVKVTTRNNGSSLKLRFFENL